MLRVAVALGLTVAGLALVGAFGGIGYASSAAHSFVSAISSSGGNGNADNGSASARSAALAGQSSAADQYAAKTTICHRTNSAKNPWVVITVSNNSLPAHKAHGDTLVGPGGTCPGSPIP